MSEDPNGWTIEPDEEDYNPPLRSRTWIRVVAIVLVVGLLGLYALRPSRNAAVEEPADFTLAGLRASDPDLSAEDLRGRPVVINFWASWCIPCRKEMPLLEQRFKELSGEGLVVVGVDVMDAPDNALKFLESIDVTYPVVTDDADALSGPLQVSGLPQTLFLAPTETALDKALAGDFSESELVLGELTEAQLDAALEAILRDVA